LDAAGRTKPGAAAVVVSGMDITFEDVAHVIQDARYQQAILDTTPRPDKRIPQLPRSFNVEQFMQAHDIRAGTVMAEPLGRWFLRKFADLDVRVKEKNKPSIGLAPANNLKLREETRFLKFVAAVYELRRQDPDHTASFVEILRLLREFRLDGLDSVNAFLNANADEHTAVPLAQAMRRACSEEYASETLVATDTESEPFSSEDHISLSVELEQGDKASESDEILEFERGSEEKEEQYAANDRLPKDTQSNKENTGRTPNRVTGLTKVRTTAGGAKMMMTHRGRAMRQHSVQSVDLNNAVQRMMETLVEPIFRRLVNHRQAFMLYLRFKVFSLQPIGDRQIRYHRVLGQGAFGTVHGCIVAQTGTMLAMKIMSKKRIKVKHSKSQVVAERFALEALALHPSPYCMRLRYAYQTKEAFHLILPLAIGGDLKIHLRHGPFDEERGKFYAAEIALGLGHIHSLGFIMRDLKPRNILLDSEGHCKLSDFGLAASIDQGRLVKGRAGTEGYWSPSVVDNIPYGIDADWWSFGCCVFELFTAFNPFSCKHTGLKTRNEGTRHAPIKYTRSFPPCAKPLVSALLDRNPETRLGCGGGGVEEVLSPKFSFWRGLDMNALRRGDHPVPWVPEKGVIYAASQSEMLDNDDDPNGVALRRVKLLPEDIPEFDDFVDLEDHMLDIIKVLELSTDVSAVMNDLLKKPSSNNAAKSRSKSLGNLVEAPLSNGCCSIS